MTTVAEYFAVLGLQPDRASFTLGERLLSGIGAGASRLVGVVAAAFAAGAIKDFVAGTIAALPAINDLAAQTGFTAEEIQRLGFAAGQSGADADLLNTSLLKFTKNVGEAAKGGSGAVEAFTALGISVVDIEKRNPRDLFSQVANGLAKVQTQAERAEIAQSLFGLSGTKLVPFLAQGEDAIAALGDEAQNLGQVISAETIERVDKLGDSLDAANGTFLGAARGLLLTLLPALEAGAEAFSALAKIVARLPALLQRNARVIRVVAAVVGAVLVAALLKAAFAFVATTVASALTLLTLGGLVPLGPAVAAAFQIAAAGATQLLLRFLALAAPVIVIAGLLALIVLVVDDIITGIKGGDSFFADFIGRFGQLRELLTNVATDDSFGIFSRIFAAAGAYVVGVLEIIDGQFNDFFSLLDRLVSIKDFIVNLFTDPVETLKVFFLDSLTAFRDLVSQSLGLASRVASALATVTPDALGGANFASAATALAGASSGVGAINPAVNPVVRSIVGGSSSSVSVGAPQVSVSVTGVSDPSAAAAAVSDSLPGALAAALRAAAVDLLPDGG